jgi:glycine/D-amino acid oxidase-like deaminating enzyme
MGYDTRRLLHYFRLMPDGRFLFGMRGGLFSGRVAENKARQALQREFGAMFPAWRNVELEGTWSGLASVARNKMPFAGPVPGHPNILAGLCFHGNGVAMGSYVGHLLGHQVLGRNIVPVAMRAPLGRFPLGRARRVLMPFVYAGFTVADAVSRKG